LTKGRVWYIKSKAHQEEIFPAYCFSLARDNSILLPANNEQNHHQGLCICLRLRIGSAEAIRLLLSTSRWPAYHPLNFCAFEKVDESTSLFRCQIKLLPVKSCKAALSANDA
jgi:hypothetical protein